MKKLLVILLSTFFVVSVNSFAQEKSPKSNLKPKTEQTKKKDAKIVVKSDDKSVKTDAKTDAKKGTDKPVAGDKALAGAKGPDGQAVYQGSKGGQYYINKNGNKTYIKAEDKAVTGKKGPEGQPVLVGEKGGEYYINKNGNKTYLKK